MCKTLIKLLLYRKGKLRRQITGQVLDVLAPHLPRPAIFKLSTPFLVIFPQSQPCRYLASLLFSYLQLLISPHNLYCSCALPDVADGGRSLLDLIHRHIWDPVDGITGNGHYLTTCVLQSDALNLL